MTDKMSDIVYVHVSGHASPIKERGYSGYTTYIRQDSINVPDGLDGTLEGFKRNGIPAMIGFEPIYKAALELQRIKGLK